MMNRWHFYLKQKADLITENCSDSKPFRGPLSHHLAPKLSESPLNFWSRLFGLWGQHEG